MNLKVQSSVSLLVMALVGGAITATSAGALTPAPAVETRNANSATTVSEKVPNPADFPALLAEGTEAPDFTIEGVDGKPIHLSDYRGKVVMLEFWATYCPICQKAIPHANDVARRYKDQDVVLLGMDFLDSKKDFKKWVSKHKTLDMFTFGIDTEKDQNKTIAQRQYIVSITPTVYVIGKDGKVVQTVVSFPGPDDRLENALKKAGVSIQTASASGDGGKS